MIDWWFAWHALAPLRYKIWWPFFIPAMPAMMCHFIREIPGGVEFRSRFWMGCDIVEKKPKKKLPSFIKIPARIPRGLATHCICEYTNLASFLPQMYEKQRGKML